MEVRTMSDNKFMDMLIDKAIESYKQIMGEEKWLSLSEKEQEIAVHEIVMGFANAYLTEKHNQ
jgi:hypothetical protein